MTKKEIKGYITNGAAVDITNIPLEKAYELATHTTTIDTSRGVYGITGALLKDTRTGDLYAITSRNSILFAMV